jgi:hypothetical protein
VGVAAAWLISDIHQRNSEVKIAVAEAQARKAEAELELEKLKKS